MANRWHGVFASLGVACTPPAQSIHPSTRTTDQAAEPTTDSAAFSPPPTPLSTPNFFCVVDWAGAELGEATRLHVAWVTWLRDARPLFEQFQFTPWREMPPEARLLVAERWKEQLERRRVQLAIETESPVSEMSLSCAIDAPHCFEIDHAENQRMVGGIYALVLHEQFRKVLTAATVADGSPIRAALEGIDAEAIHYGIVEATLTDAVTAELRNRASVWSELRRLDALLPESAVLPRQVSLNSVTRPANCTESEFATLPRFGL